MRLSARDGGRRLAAAAVALAAAVLFAWIPLDVETGIAERVRGRTAVGDSLAPAVAAVVLALAGLMTALESRREDSSDDSSDDSSGESSGANPPPESVAKADWNVVRFPLVLLALFVSVVVVFRWAGPFAVWVAGMFNPDLPEYRLLRDSVPWKYIGFCGGGFLLTLTCIALAERRISRRALWLAVLSPLAIALLYDLPFDDLLLPPNGDV